MAAPKGNQNSKGNKGGKSHNDRVLAGAVRRLAMKEIERILLGDDEDYKKQLILKLATTVLPRINEHTGEGGGAIKVNIVRYGDSDPV